MTHFAIGRAAMDASQGSFRIWALLSALWTGFWVLVLPAVAVATWAERGTFAEALPPDLSGWLALGALAFLPPTALYAAGRAVSWVVGGFIRGATLRPPL